MTNPLRVFLGAEASAKAAEPDGQTRPPTRDITVADLLLHTSGLSHRTSELYRTAKVRSRSITLPQFITNITRTPLMEDPGTRYRYSEGTTVVGRLIEIWSGKPLDVVMRERLFDPLGMVDTDFWATPEQRAQLAKQLAQAGRQTRGVAGAAGAGASVAHPDGNGRQPGAGQVPSRLAPAPRARSRPDRLGPDRQRSRRGRPRASPAERPPPDAGRPRRSGSRLTLDARACARL